VTIPERIPPILAFAADYLRSRGIKSHKDVRSDDLADAVRAVIGSPKFPTKADLLRLYEAFDISLQRLPPVGRLDGLNGWYGDGRPIVSFREDVLIRRQEQTLGHEVREVIENAFKRVDPDYEGLPTDDNPVMNKESDYFASCLLMPREESRSRLLELDYDYVRFGRELRRPLSSVVARSQSLFPQNSGLGPVAALWLFEISWEQLTKGTARVEDMKVQAESKLNGFSTAKDAGPVAEVARLLFPHRQSRVGEFQFVKRAVETRRPQGQILKVDLFGDRDFLVVVEPISSSGQPWQALMTAVRLDCARMIEGWLQRLGMRSLIPRS